MATVPSLYEATVAGRLHMYHAYLDTGKGTPLLYPWDILPALYLFVGVIIRPSLNAAVARVLNCVLFVFIVLQSMYILQSRRCLGFAGGYGIGLTACWGIIMALVLLIIDQPDKDFVRLEIREASAATTYVQSPEGVSYSTEKVDILKQVKARKGNDFTQAFEPKAKKSKDKGHQYCLVWQPFPTTFWHQVEWTIGLLITFRGANWNFRIPTLHRIETLPPPPGYKTSKAIGATMLANEAQNPSDTTQEPLLHRTMIATLKLYLLVDFVKTVMITDPYFLGLRPITSLSPWPYVKDLPNLAIFLRLALTLVGVVSWLSLVFSLKPLFYGALLPKFISQATLLKFTKTPLYDPRMYEPQFHSLPKNIANGGLAFLWGRSWHQMFRFGISEPARPIMETLRIKPKSQAGRAVQLLVAFSLTGMLHMFASYTTFSIMPTKPLNPFWFFVLQGVGIILQTTFTDFFTKQMKLRPPPVVRKSANIIFFLVWAWYTGPLLADDFARGGVWLFEPCPLSFFRGLTGQGWWHWRGRWAGIYRGSGWLSTGIAAY